MSDFVPTPADEYPVVCDQELELPSGAKVIVRRPSMFLMVRRGQIPAEAREVVERMGRKEEVSEADQFVVLDCLVAASFVSPKVSLKRKKGCVCIDDMPDDDRLAVIKALDLKKVI